MRILVGLLVLSVLTSGCATSSSSASAPDDIGVEQALFMMRQLGAPQRGDLSAAIAKADAFPLGSKENPVRAAMPPGQHAYLARLRCADGKPPEFGRIGSFGAGVYGTIIDGYQVVCPASSPAETVVFMDMYHKHVEDRPIPGFTIVGGVTPPENPTVNPI